MQLLTVLYTTRGITTLSLLSALLLIATTPYVSLPYAAFLALVPLFLLAELGILRRDLLGIAFVLGTIYGIAILWPLSSLDGWWFAASPFFLEWKAWFWNAGIVLVAALGFGIFFVLFFLLYRKVSDSRALAVFGHALLYGGLWLVLEYVRELLAFGFTWGHLGYALHNTPLLDLADPLGVYGMGAFLIVINILLARSLMFVLTKENARASRAPFVMIVCLICAAFLYSAQYGPEDFEHGNALSVAVINARIPFADSIGPRNFDVYFDLAQRAARATDTPDIIVLPESVFYPLELNRETRLPLGYDDEAQTVGERYDRLIALSRTFPQTVFVFGLKTRLQGERYSSMLVYQNGIVTDIYDKQELLPFAERVQSIHENRLTGSLTPGAAAQYIEVGGYHASAFICSEIIFPRLAERDSEFIVSVSNEDAFKSPVAAKHNHIMAKFRAAENRQYLLRAVKDGLSSIIAPDGTEVALSDLQNTSILRGTIFVKER